MTIGEGVCANKTSNVNIRYRQNPPPEIVPSTPHPPPHTHAHTHAHENLVHDRHATTTAAAANTTAAATTTAYKHPRYTRTTAASFPLGSMSPCSRSVTVNTSPVCRFAVVPMVAAALRDTLTRSASRPGYTSAYTSTCEVASHDRAANPGELAVGDRVGRSG